MADPQHPLIQPRALAAVTLAGISAAGWGLIAAQFIVLGFALSLLGAASTIWLYWGDFQLAIRAASKGDFRQVFKVATKELWIEVVIIILSVTIPVWLSFQSATAATSGTQWGWVYLPAVLLFAVVLGFLYGYRERSNDAPSTIPIEARVYVTQMGVAENELFASPSKLEIYIRGQNATGQSIDVISASGSINYREYLGSQLVDEGGTLAPPTLDTTGRTQLRIPDNSDFLVIFQLPVPRKVAEGIRSSLDSGHNFHFGLHDLNIMMAIPSDGNQSRLRVWSGMTLNKTKDHIWCGQIIEMQMRAAEVKLN
jgi:hypothetical protein